MLPFPTDLRNPVNCKKVVTKCIQKYLATSADGGRRWNAAPTNGRDARCPSMRSRRSATLPHGEPPSWRRNGKGGAGAQTIAIPALPQRARCALSQYAARSRRSAPLPWEDRGVWRSRRSATLPKQGVRVNGVRKGGAGRIRQDSEARRGLAWCRGCAGCADRPPA